MQKEKLKKIINDISLDNPYLTSEQIKKAYATYIDDERNPSIIIDELEKISTEIVESHTNPNFEKEYYYHKKRFEELSSLYKKNKSKYKTKDFKIIDIYEIENIQSYNATKKVKLIDENGYTTYGFYKGKKSPNEYELLVSRLGYLFDIPVAEFSLYLDNKHIEGISIDCNSDQEKYDFILGYEFIENKESLQKTITEMKKQQSITHIDENKIKNYFELFFNGLRKKVNSKKQLEQIKKDYLSMVLFNVILDQKDFNYTNVGILRNRLNDFYQIAPLFDNGNIKDLKRSGTIIIGVEPAYQNDVLDVLYSDYYLYIQDFSKCVTAEFKKYISNNPNKITQAIEIINDTLLVEDCPLYIQILLSNIENIAHREQQKSS